MKKSTFLAIFSLFVLSLFLTPDVFGQVRTIDANQSKQQARTGTPSGDKCGTMQWLEAAFRQYPGYRIAYADNERRLAEAINRQIIERQNNPGARTQALITIPIVFHVVGNAALQASLTDAKVLAQLDTLNHDFSGFNGDSTNIPAAFQAVRGHSNLRFCLAQRTPNDLPATGINRVTSNTVSTGTASQIDPIKSTASGGADAWDPTRYFNVWLCSFTDPTLLGYATFPIGSPEGGNPNANQQGVVVLGQSIPGGTAAPYNKGRTLTHEAGHFFWLRHITGDANCGNDFPGTPGIDDTPAQASLTGGCPTGAVASGCAASPNPPGKMYQNYMDYTDDACMTMFTIGQATRAEMAINMFRASFLTSNGCTPPPAAAGNDARISAIVNPVNASTTSCSPVTPVVTVMNMGTSPLSSVTINVRLNGTQQYFETKAISPALAQGGTANFTLLTPVNLVTGTNTFKIHTTNPNGSPDATPANDTSTSVVTKIAAATLPVIHAFADPTLTNFVPPGWSVVNPDGLTTWGWFFTDAARSDTAAAMRNFPYDAVGQNDDIRTASINTSGLLANDSLLITFEIAHKNYPGQFDHFQVLVSTNCGTSYTTVFDKSSTELTTGALTTEYGTVAPTDWVKQRTAIGNNLFGGGQVMVAFRNVNDFGNTMWLDDINISIKPRKDMQALTMVKPLATECTSPIIPSLTVRNNGGETVSAFKTGYILNGGAPVIQANNISLASGASTTVTFPSLAIATGSNTIKMFVTDAITPSPGPDGTPTNDTLTRTFFVPVTVTNVVQGFEGSTFIPSNWALINANANVTWTRKNVGKSSDWSAFIDNYNNNTINQLDLMQAPPVNTVGADSVIITFDVAHKDYPGSLDRLRVLVSTNCGASFTAVYSKAGSPATNPAAPLSTAGSTDQDYTTAAQTDWRNETIRLNNAFTGGNIIVQFENRNDFGNNIFIDNINIAPKFKRDLEVLGLAPDVACATGFTPTATIRNRGTEAVTGYKIAYSVGAAAPVSQTVTGVNIAPGATTTYTFPAGTLAAGPNSIRVYTYEPVTASGTGDLYVLNDTINKTSYAVSTVTAPNNVVETFEAGFVPTGWAVGNPDNSLTWQKAGVGKSSAGSAYLRNFAYYTSGQRDLLYTPVLAYTGVDSVKLSFDLSATTKDYPGSTTLGLDTLEVLVSRDCGNSFTSVYKKWGQQLQTIGDANYPQPTEFTPTSPYLWRTERIDLTSFAPNGPLQVIFRNTSNNQNDVYIDNVNFRTVVLPPRLKAEGVIVTPNPFANQFRLWFVQAPTDLRYITVLNAAGQLVWNKVYGSGSTSNVIDINMSGMAAGVYTINLGYTNSDKQIKIIKSN